MNKHKQPITGSGLTPTAVGVFVAAITAVALTPIARIKDSGKLTKWNPAGTDGSQVAIGLTVGPLDTTSGEQSRPYYIGGTFNPDEIAWPQAATAAQKLGAFDGTDIHLKAALD
ncbi:head decoration protein [Pseudoalteromonas ruthenica]|uniref:head decoration protein n=1 Tax=Pseudoalteromonas ruthenica TaxID=151081 RepID=UPI00110BC0EB|nr:head decoration protein [Pseudoalteromonas ruthenica]TMP23774.1 hypothetical protein CWC06_09480 [Pseudoalteromonas ruthenica]